MLKKSSLLAAVVLLASEIFAADVKLDGKDFGEFHTAFKVISVLTDKRNGFAPSNGTAYLLKLKYETPSLLREGLKLGSGVYVNGDAGLTKWDENSAERGYNKGAYGLVVAPDGEDVGHLGELYVAYKSGIFSTKLGRQELDTPLTKIQISLMPNFYEAYMFGVTLFEDVKLTAGQITRLSYGSRAAADSGIIGENTSTAGAIAALIRPTPGPIAQAEFYNIGTIAGTQNTDGRGVFGLRYEGLEDFRADVWFYRSYDIADDFYAHIAYDAVKYAKTKLTLETQYLAQNESGAAFAGEKDFALYGFKAAFDATSWGVFAASNHSDKGADPIAAQYFNPWGGDAAFTSTIFSRNAYRSGVDAYKVGGHYVLFKGLRYMLEYASYGKSDATLGNAAGKFALTDAYELDNILVYKPSKEWFFRIFHAYRVSEFDGWAVPGISSERKMSHVRVIAQYAF